MSTKIAPQKIEISHKTIIFTVIFLLSLAVLWQIRSIIVLLFIAFVLMEALNPAVNRLTSFKIPRPLAILFLYTIILAVIAFAVAGIVPVFIEQTDALVNSLPAFLENTKFLGTSAIDLSSQFRIIENLPQNVAKITLGIFSNIFSSFIIFVITFYLIMERKKFDQYSFDVFGQNGKEKINQIIDQLEKRLGTWVGAEMLLMTVIGLLAYVGYLVLGLNYAVPLAIIAGLLEIVPNIGPTLATALAALVGFTISPLTGILAIVWGIVIQQLENNYIVPKIMKATVGLNPLITIVLIAVGAQLGGVLGAILALPIYLTVEIIYRVLSSPNK